MKKLLQQSLLLAACLLASIPASALKFEKGGIYYTRTSAEAGHETYEVTYKDKNYNTYSGSVTIPDNVENEGVTYSVTGIGDDAFKSCAELTAVKIPAAATSVGTGAFSGCPKLTSIKLPAGITKINNSAFDGCTGLTAITIPDGVASIGINGFRNCSALTSVIIPVALTKIGVRGFSGCSGLQNIYLLSTTTPKIYGDDPCFDAAVFSNANLNVPKGSKNTYATADGWKSFKNIKEFDATHIGDVTDGDVKVSVSGGSITVTGAPEKAPVSVYDAAGQKVYSGTETTITVSGAGVYIVKVAGKRVKVKM